MPLDADTCYRALVSRDRRFDGHFIVGVHTTGIYCRPGCPARTPLRKSVDFFACAAAAEQAGLRPCLRCRPDATPGTAAANLLGTPATVSRALRLIREGALASESEGQGVEGLAARLGISGRHLRAQFQQHLGCSPIAYAQSERVHLARKLVAETQLPMSEIAYAAGFGSVRRFNDALRTVFRVPPSTLRKAGAATDESAPTLRLPFRAPLDCHSAARLSGRARRPRRRSGRRRRGALSPHVVGGRRRGGGRDRSAFRRRLPSDLVLVTLKLPRPGRAHSPSWRGCVVCSISMPIRGALPSQLARADRRSSAGRRRWPPAVRRRPLRALPGAWDGFELAVGAILGQQVSVKAATSLCSRLVARFGAPIAATPPLTHLFPTPQKLAHADVAAIGLPGARARANNALARAVVDDGLALDGWLDADAATSALTALPGIGPWTAQYIAMRMGQPDAFPAGDLVLRKRAGQITERELLARAEAWRPFRAYAALHLWADESEGKPS